MPVSTSTSRPMRILQVLPSLESGGVETGTIDIANALIQAGHQAFVVSSGGKLVPKLDAIGARHFTLPVHSKNPWQMWQNSRSLDNLIQEQAIDLIHARSRAPAWSCLWASNRTGIPFVTTFHGTYSHQNALKRWYNSAMLRSDLTIAVSGFIADHIHSIYPSLISNRQQAIQVIHRGIDLQKFDPSVDQRIQTQTLRQTWDISEHDTVIMLPGRLTRWKGQLQLIHAISKLDTQNLRCLLVGDNKGKDHFLGEVNNLISHYQLEHCVKWVGGCQDMPKAYALADIVVSASTDPEAFGRVACEAQAMHCITIASKHGGSLETIAPSQQAYWYEPEDIDTLAVQLKKAVQHVRKSPKQTHAEAYASARQFIAENFSLVGMGNATIQVYQSLIEKHLCHDRNP